MAGISRRRFVTLAAAPVLAAASPPTPGITRAASALVLGGGGARGSYEAGILDAMRGDTPDGMKLPGVDVVCGTSIGAVTAWFVATGQYGKLTELWHHVAAENVFAIKHRFAATSNPHAFIITRILQALSLAQGLTTNVQGILDGGGVERFLDRHVDPSVPVLVPFVCTVTNLDRSRPELFYRLPFAGSPEGRAASLDRLRRTVGPSVAIREVSDEMLKLAIRASTAIPVLFDPVVMTSPEGTADRYVDGGIADQNPIDVGRALARSVYAVVLDPETRTRQAFANAFTVAVGAFGVAQTRMLESALEQTSLETQGKRLFDSPALAGAQRSYMDGVLDCDLYAIRPQTELGVEVAEFDRQEKIDATFRQGVADFARGWQPFTRARADQLATPSPGASPASPL